ncbi:efflux RND transporter periplasmic adaptor subunit [Neogemmobacter tilapiae]|uniref:Membrane protein n=1 Tax=Neogemmobacter tilapiae TaxID=875041 RepID=A0A918TXE5_9RHOB|nr:efflux RND transporter periplasmic adaptor subunit [Gemmobacter tilapiae]GHC60953.1 membrane protein [Gemmobacter tilapiae]
MLRVSLIALLLAGPLAAAEYEVQPVLRTETKALFGTVEARFVSAARARIGGTLVELTVVEGDIVQAGQPIGRLADAKLDSALAAAEGQLASAQSQQDNALAELTRNETLLERGAVTVQRVDQLRTQLGVAEGAVRAAKAARETVLQQMADGAVLAPADGRVLALPGRLGSVVMPGEAVATVAGGGLFLRLAIPERHAAGLALGALVDVAGQGGQIEKIYPQIEQGRVMVDVAVAGLDKAFVGQRVLVAVPVAEEQVLAVPETALDKVSGLDLVHLVGGATVTVVPGRRFDAKGQPMREILSGLRPGDLVVTP